MSGATPGTRKVLEKLQKCIENGSYYEAQQMYKTVYARYMVQRKYDQAIELVTSGAKLQLQHGQVLCGSELALLVVEALVKAEVKCDAESLGRIKDIFESFPREEHETVGSYLDAVDVGGLMEEEEVERAAQTKSRVEACTSFLKQAVRWSRASGAPSAGAPELHDMLADYIWSQSHAPNLLTVSRHFVCGSRPEAFAAALVEVMKASHPLEADLVFTRGMLQYLAVGKVWDATRLFDEVRRRCNDVEDEDAPWLPDSPLMHFCRFLLSALERKVLPLFTMLRKKYRPSINRDPTFEKYLDEVGVRFFNQRRQPAMPGMLGDLFKAITGED